MYAGTIGAPTCVTVAPTVGGSEIFTTPEVIVYVDVPPGTAAPSAVTNDGHVTVMVPFTGCPELSSQRSTTCVDGTAASRHTATAINASSAEKERFNDNMICRYWRKESELRKLTRTMRGIFSRARIGRRNRRGTNAIACCAEMSYQHGHAARKKSE